jgi:hypothetical protein
VTVAGLSVSAIGLRSAKISHLLALERNFRVNLWSRIFNIRFLKVETRFESHETGSITAAVADVAPRSREVVREVEWRIVYALQVNRRYALVGGWVKL